MNDLDVESADIQNACHNAENYDKVWLRDVTDFG